MKKLLTLIISIGFLISSVQYVNAANVPDEQWFKSPAELGTPSWGVLLNEDTGSESPFAYMLSYKSDTYQMGTGKLLDLNSCSSFNSVECPLDEYQDYQTPLSYCQSELEFDCISKLLIKDSNGKPLKYSFVRDFPGVSKWAFSGNKEYELPKSGSTFLIDIPEARHAGGSLYWVGILLAGHRYPGQNKFITDRFNARIAAVSIENGTYFPGEPGLNLKNYSSFTGAGRSGDPRCTIQCSSTERLLGQPMPTDLSFGFQSRLNAKVSGWLNGRVANVISTISTDSAGNQVISVEGNPVKVPIVFGWLPKATSPESLKNFYGAMSPQKLNSGNGYGLCLDPARSSSTPSGPCNPIYWESVLRMPEKNQEGMNEIALWLPLLEDKAVAAPTFWNINSISGKLLNGCSATSDRLSGIVTTNASGYISGPPVYNNVEKTLDYKVLAPHILNDGSVFKGTYDLIIDSTFARCIYGFSTAPVSATVSIISNGGTAEVATVVASEKNGWFRLGAYGFTFSSPTVRVKFSQDQPQVSPKIESKVKSKKAEVIKKNITISCLKGKQVKQISSIKPKCPAGYKKK